MFTGIVSDVARVMDFAEEGHVRRLCLEPPAWARETAVGDSVAINGVCLTVLGNQHSLDFQIVQETLNRTNLGSLAAGDLINLERPLRLSDRLNGHIVLGHVDGVAEVIEILVDETASGDANRLITLSAPAKLMSYVVEKGSVALDGISLTVASAADTTFSVAIIPHSWDQTNLKQRRVGDSVNLEVDLVAKYIAKWTARGLPTS